MRRTLVATAVAGLAVTGLVTLGHAAPTCPTSGTEAACGGRVVAEPINSATFLQYGTEVFPALKAIEKIAPDLITVQTLAEATGNPAYKSAGGRDIPVVRVTDEKSTRVKRKVALSLSVHGQESAGREGGVRYVEDLARWWKGDRQHKIYAGAHVFPLAQVMAQTDVWICICNPDGWARMDLPVADSVSARTNDNGTDLNREFPTLGWTNQPATPMSDPESKGWVALLRKVGKLSTASDIHGELTSANNAFSDLMWPAAQWTPRRQEQERQLGLDVIATVNRKFADDLALLGTALDTLGVMKPAKAATGYDVVGYDDGGFMGDWFAQEMGAVEIDAENFLSHIAPGPAWFAPLEQAHVAAVRGIIEAVIVESMVTDTVRVRPQLGKVAYVFDARRVRSSDGLGYDPEAGEHPKSYDVSRMDYFRDLSAVASQPLTAIASSDVARVDLSRFDTLVLDDVAIPPDTHGRAVLRATYVAALKKFANAGGQVLLTDKAVQLLSAFGFGDEGQLKSALTNAGHIDFGTQDHPWEKGLLETSSQTYYEVPLGFRPTNAAPHFGVTTAAWSAAHGVTVGTVSGFTALGELPLGKGKVSIFGALLHTPTEDETHVEGLASYGVTITGGQVLNAILAYRSPQHGGKGGLDAPGQGGGNEGDGGSLPATGGAATLWPLLLVALAFVVRRRRRLTS